MCVRSINSCKLLCCFWWYLYQFYDPYQPSNTISSCMPVKCLLLLNCWAPVISINPNSIQQVLSLAQLRRSLFWFFFAFLGSIWAFWGTIGLLFVLSYILSLWWVVGWFFFSNYRVSPNFLIVLGLRLWLRLGLGLGCDNRKKTSLESNKLRI